MGQHPKLIYKIVADVAWQEALAAGVFRGAAIDLADGYVHLSDASQVRETAARHFAAQPGLVLVAFDADGLGPDLRWEVSRGGALFPHLHAPLDPQLALWVKPLPWVGDAHQFPEL
jgi:uncharacterized protein (DUF952 family)